MAYIVPNPYVKKSMLLCYIRHYIACVTENEFQLATIFNRCSRKEPELPEIIKTCSIALQYCNEWLVPVPSQSFDGLKNRWMSFKVFVFFYWYASFFVCCCGICCCFRGSQLKSAQNLRSPSQLNCIDINKGLWN